MQAKDNNGGIKLLSGTDYIALALTLIYPAGKESDPKRFPKKFYDLLCNLLIIDNEVLKGIFERKYNGVLGFADALNSVDPVNHKSAADKLYNGAQILRDGVKLGKQDQQQKNNYQQQQASLQHESECKAFESKIQEPTGQLEEDLKQKKDLEQAKALDDIANMLPEIADMLRIVSDYIEIIYDSGKYDSKSNESTEKENDFNNKYRNEPIKLFDKAGYYLRWSSAMVAGIPIFWIGGIFSMVALIFSGKCYEGAVIAFPSGLGCMALFTIAFIVFRNLEDGYLKHKLCESTQVLLDKLYNRIEIVESIYGDLYERLNEKYSSIYKDAARLTNGSPESKSMALKLSVMLAKLDAFIIRCDGAPGAISKEYKEFLTSTFREDPDPSSEKDKRESKQRIQATPSSGIHASMASADAIRAALPAKLNGYQSVVCVEVTASVHNSIVEKHLPKNMCGNIKSSMNELFS